MKISKRNLVTIITILILMCLSMLAACGTSDKDNQPTAPTSDSGTTGDVKAPTSDSGTTGDTPESPADPKYADQIVSLFPSADLAVISPHNAAANSPTASKAYKMYLDTLVVQDYDTLEIMPYLAERWDDVDSTEFTFYLRDDVYFHNGEKLTADDVIFTVYASKTWGQGAASRDTWDLIETYTKLDENTVNFKLKNKDIDFLSKIASQVCGIVSEKAVTEDEIEGYMIGSGAYKITDFSPMDHVSFERNENYWGEKPVTKYQTWRIVPEANTRAIMLQTGEADAILATISEGDIEMFMSEPDSYVLLDQPPSGGPQAIIFNMTDAITGDYNFRSACIHAIDREEVAMLAQGPYGYIAETEGTMWGYYTIYRDHDIPYIEYDLEKAKEYLEKSAYNGEEIEILTAFYESSNLPKAAEVIQQQLARIGIKTKITVTDNAGIQAARREEARGDLQILLWVETLSGTTTNSYKPVFGTGAARNGQSFSDPELDELLALDAQTDYGPDKEVIAHRMQEIVTESRCAANLFWLKNAQVAVKGFGGIRPLYLGADYRYIYKVLDD